VTALYVRSVGRSDEARVERRIRAEQAVLEWDSVWKRRSGNGRSNCTVSLPAVEQVEAMRKERQRVVDSVTEVIT